MNPRRRTLLPPPSAPTPRFAPPTATISAPSPATDALLLVGAYAKGSLVAHDWFARVTVGTEYRTDGFAFCGTGQTVSSAGKCLGTVSMVTDPQPWVKLTTGQPW